MSYNSKLLQTGRKVASARRKYYGSFDYGSGIDAKLRGGTFSFGKKFWSGGDTWYGGKDSEAFKSKFLGSSSSGTNWSGLLGVGTGFIGDIFSGEKDMSNKYNSLMESTTNFGNDYYTGIQDNSGLIAALQNSSPISSVSSSDIRNKSIGQDIGSALTTGLNAGMSTGNVWVGIGAAALDAGKSVLQRLQAQTYADRVNQYIKDKNIRLNQDAFMVGEGVDAHNDWMRMMRYYMNPYDYAFGGPLHSNGGDYNGGLTYIDEGGRHEENPYEGVPSGFDEEGNPNLVEEGEVIWNNEYVFSDRLKVPKELANKYKLGGKKDYTFAEAIEKLTKENNISPNDFITIATTKEIVNEFMDAQEALRQEEQIAAREELEAAQAQDFLAQLDAAQGGTPQSGPIDFQLPAQVQEGLPVGFAVGGNKGVPKHPSIPYDIYIPDDTNNPKSIASRTRQFANVLASYKPLMQAVGDIPGYYKYSVLGREILDKAYQPYNESAREHTRLMLLRQAAEAEKQPNNTKALGGNKFQNGSWKNYVTEGKDKSGTPIFTTSDGRVFYSEAGARKYVDLNKEYLVSRLSDFVTSPAPARVVADAPRQSLPAGIKAVYSKGRNGQRGPVHHYETSDGLNMGTDLDKAIRHQNALDGVNVPAQETTVPMMQEPALPNLVSSSIVPASTVTATRTLPTAQPQVQQVAQSQIAAQQVQPEVTINSKGQEEETLPDGIKVVYSKGRNGNRGPVHHYETSDGLNMGTNRDKAVQYQTRLNQGNTETVAAVRTVPSPSFQDINIFGTPNGGFDLFSYAPQDYVSVPVAQAAVQSQDTSVPTEEQAAARVATASTSSGKSSIRTSGTTGRMTTPSGETIKYKKDIDGKAFESQQYYQDFIRNMDSIKGSDKAQEWIDYINQSIKDQGDKYHINSFDEWRRLALDGKVGPVHQATLKAAEYFAKRQGLTAVNPNGGPNPTIAEVLGVRPESIAGASQSPVSGSTQTSSGSGTAQEPQFNYRDTRLRYAPPIGAAMDWLYRRLNRPDYSNADRIIEAAYRMGTPINIPVETIGDYRRRNPYDERYLVNMANQNRAAAARGIANTAGGNRSMDLLGNMSLAHSNQQELGEIMRQAYLANRQDDAQVADFNRGTNVYNMNAINQRNLSQAQLNTHRQQAGLSGLAQGYGLRQTIHDNWDDAAMESYNSLLASLGAIGKENEENNMLTSMAEHGYFPYYYGDRGILQFSNRYKYDPFTGEKLVAKGGKLNRKKRRF